MSDGAADWSKMSTAEQNKAVVKEYYQTAFDGDPERAVAEAKLSDAESLDDAVAWLRPRERMVALHDRALIALLMRLPAAKG